MSDHVQVTTSQSWVSRVGGSFAGALFGGLMALAAFPLLFWNEGRAVTTANTLNRGAKVVVDVAADHVDPANDGALVHLSGRAETAATLTDAEFGVSANALVLSRKVEMYQWKESSSSETKTKLGGGQQTVTNYDYSKDWSDSLNDSTGFQEPNGHTNPSSMPFEGQKWTADHVTLGAFTIPTDIVDDLGDGNALPVPDTAATGDRRIAAGGLYVGKDPASPAVGDLKITFTALAPSTISVVAAQTGDTLQPYTGAGKPIQLAAVGDHTAEAMFTDAKAENTLILWFVRALGYLMMAIGLMLVFNPLSVLGDVIPFIGSLMGFGVFLFGFIVAVPLSLVTIALGWIVYRPLVGIALLAVAGAVTWAALRLRKGAAGSAKGTAAA